MKLTSLSGRELYLWLALGLIGAGYTPAGDQVNLLRNGGFEDAIQAMPRQEPQWCLGQNATITSRLAHTGIKALGLNAAGPGQRSEAYQTIAGLKTGQFYRVDAWIKTDGLAPDDKGAASLYAGGMGSFGATGGNHDWEWITGWFQAKSNTAENVYCFFADASSGAAYFDDVSCRPCDDPSVSPVTFEDGSTLGLQLARPGTMAEVVAEITPQGTRCLYLQGSASYRLSRPLTSGPIAFHFLLKVKGRGQVGIGTVNLSFAQTLVNEETVNGKKAGNPLSALVPERWYGVKGLIHLDSQTYDLAVTDFDDPLYSFSRKRLSFSGVMDKVAGLSLNVRKGSAWFDDIYVGPAGKMQTP